MTNEEAINKLLNLKEIQPFLDYRMAIELGVVALEKQAITDKTSDKYRWHDLRKNPNDLPIKDAIVYMEHHDGIHYDYVHAFFDNKGWFEVESAEYFNDIYLMEFWEVIGWKYIEPFEVEE